MDNALRDDTRSVLEAAQKKLPSFKAVRLNQNTEFSAASNLGAEFAGGPVLVMLN
jgi:GT2 family glycosyltransferase